MMDILNNLAMGVGWLVLGLIGLVFVLWVVQVLIVNFFDGEL